MSCEWYITEKPGEVARRHDKSSLRLHFVSRTEKQALNTEREGERERERERVDLLKRGMLRDTWRRP